MFNLHTTVNVYEIFVSYASNSLVVLKSLNKINSIVPKLKEFFIYYV